MDFAKRGARLILACRNEKKVKEAIRKIKDQTNNTKVIYKILDLSSFNSVRKFAADIKATENRLDILVNNAGTGAIPNELTEDGLPPTMQINYVSHFLLTNLLFGKSVMFHSPLLLSKIRRVHCAEEYCISYSERQLRAVVLRLASFKAFTERLSVGVPICL